MKKYFLPFVILIAILGLCYYLFDDSLRAVTKSKTLLSNAQTKVESLKNQRDQSSNQIVALNRSVKDSLDFLAKWKEYYTTNRDYEAVINKVAERTKCAVVGRKWEIKKVNLGKLDYDVDAFTGMVVGDYRDIVKFIGELESELQLSTIWSLEFKDGVNEVACIINVCLPTLTFMNNGGTL